MEDQNLKHLRYFKIGMIVIVVLILLIVGYIFLMKKINTDRFENYLTENNFIQKDDIYLKKVKRDKNTLYYKAYSDEFIFSKEITQEKGEDYYDLSLQYEKNGNIKIGFQLEGYNKQGAYGILYQEGSYKNGEFDCKVISGEGYDAKCDYMKEEAEKFNNEVKKLFKDNHINVNYINK